MFTGIPLRSIRRKLLWGLIAAAVVVSLLFYVVSYLFLTVSGRFEPGAIGLNGVKFYRWAPEGFVTEFKWNREIQRRYAPLYYLDQRFWHTYDEAYGDKYPVNWIPDDRIGELYQAWK